ARNRMVGQVGAEMTGSASFVKETVAHLVVKEADFFGDANANQELRASHGERAGSEVGLVAELVGNLQHPLTRSLADAGPVMKGAVNGSDRYIGTTRNVVNADPLHLVRSHNNSCNAMKRWVLYHSVYVHVREFRALACAQPKSRSLEPLSTSSALM